MNIDEYKPALFIRGHYLTASSLQAAAPQVIFYDDISDSIKDELNVVSVCSAGHMGVDPFFGWLVLALVLRLDVGDSLRISVWTWGERHSDEAQWESGERLKAGVISPFVSVACATLSISALFSDIFWKHNLWLSCSAHILLR